MTYNSSTGKVLWFSYRADFKPAGNPIVVSAAVHDGKDEVTIFWNVNLTPHEWELMINS